MKGKCGKPNIPFLKYKLRGRDESRLKTRCLDNATIFSHSVPHQQSYVYCTPSLRRRQSESTKKNPLTGLSDLSSIENALPVVTNTSSSESFPKAVALLQRDKLSFSVINRSSIFTPSSSSAIMAAILKG